MAKRSKPLASSGRRGPAKHKTKQSSPSEGEDRMDQDFKPPAAKRSAGGRANGRGQKKTATAASGKRLSQAPKRVWRGARYGVQEGHGEGCVCLLAVGQEVWSRKQQRTAQGHHRIAAEQIRDRAGPGGVQPGEVWGAPCCALC